MKKLFFAWLIAYFLGGIKVNCSRLNYYENGNLILCPKPFFGLVSKPHKKTHRSRTGGFSKTLMYNLLRNRRKLSFTGNDLCQGVGQNLDRGLDFAQTDLFVEDFLEIVLF